MDKAELILHPARLQILDALSHDPMTTQELAKELASVPKPSIYRHLRLLLEGGLVEIAETRPVKGIEEKVYRLSQPPNLGVEDMNGYSRQDHFRTYSMYLASLLQGYADYLNSSPQHDLAADFVGYHEASVYASAEELQTFAAAIQEAYRAVIENRPGKGRRKYRFSLTTYPLRDKGEQHD